MRVKQQAPRETSRATWRLRLVVGIVVVLAALFVGALVIHFVVLSSDRFNWLETGKP